MGTKANEGYLGVTRGSAVIDGQGASQQSEGLGSSDLDGRRLFAEQWNPGYGTQTVFDSDFDTEIARVEDGPEHVGRVNPGEIGPLPLCFVDGTRRVELHLWAEDPLGDRLPGLAGAFAVGAVVLRPGQPARYEGTSVSRLAVWATGYSADVRGSNGYGWASLSTGGAEVEDLMAVLQNRMRSSEGELASEAAKMGWNVVLDGPLNNLRTMDPLVAGYVKSHLRRLLPPDDHAQIPFLQLGERTALYQAGVDRYTCYCRVGWPGPAASAWAGIARLEFPTTAGVDAVAARATTLASLLPAYAGVHHRDPRAPVNLTLVRNLENHLRQLMGRPEFATRAARDAVLAIQGSIDARRQASWLGSPRGQLGSDNGRPINEKVS